jgi:c-di-GMP-binding flagellar brake protein YcgR
MSASLSNEEIEDKYFLLGQVEILNVLNDLAHRRENISVYFNAGQNFILTVILSARPDGLVFDLGGDPRSNTLLEKASQCVFMAFPDGIRVQFTGVSPQRFMWGDEEAFWVPIPQRVVRLQRRDSYRNHLPLSSGVRSKLYNIDAQVIGDWEVHDLSVGGFGIIVEGEPNIKLGERLPQVSIPVSPKTILHCAVVVRHITFIERTRLGKFQIGFSFIDLPRPMDIAIQKLILSIEYERHRLLGK